MIEATPLGGPPQEVGVQFRSQAVVNTWLSGHWDDPSAGAWNDPALRGEGKVGWLLPGP